MKQEPQLMLTNPRDAMYYYVGRRVRYKYQDSPDRSGCNLCVRLFVSDRSEKSDRHSLILSGLS